MDEADITIWSIATLLYVFHRTGTFRFFHDEAVVGFLFVAPRNLD